jgi:RND family efflux transporter MFP subunit
MWAGGGVLVIGLAGLFYLQPWATPAPVVMVETVALGPVTRVLAVNGRIAGVRSVDVRPLVSGTLVEVSVAEGDIVTRNQALMQLDTATQQAVVRQAVAGLDAAFVAQDDAVATLARTRTLGANVARVVLETAVRAEQAAAQEVARMTALLDQAQIQLEKFTIRAPIAGTVLVLNVDPGQSVDPATVLLSIADLGTLVVETDVDESYATQIRTGQPAALQLSGEAEVRAGHVSFVSQRVDEDTGGLVVRLTPEAPLTAPIGLTVTANITVDDRASAITVPRAAIISDAAADAVLVAVDGTAQRRAVEVIDWPAARLIVTDGLAPGDEVIADATGLTDGQAIQVAP